MDLSLLKHMLRIPSIFPNEGQLGKLMYDRLHTSGFFVTKQYVAKDRFNVLAEKGAGEKSIMFYGHLDTVPLYGEWDTDPYLLTAHGDQLFGLGATDMKGGMFAILEAAKDLDLPEGRKVKIAFCVDEENNSAGAYALSKNPFLDDVRLVISAEIGDARPIKAGAKSLSLGRRGRVGISISVPGISAHGAMAEKGVNAILEAYTLIRALKQMPMPQHDKLGRGSQFVQEISAKSGSLSVPDHCEIYLCRLLVPPETPESALQEIQQYIEGLYAGGTLISREGKKAVAALAKRATPYYIPYFTETDVPQVNGLIRKLKTHFGDVCIGYGLSVADENIFGGINKIPTVTLGPQGGNEHSANEWVSKQSLAELIPVYHDIMLSLEI